MARSLLEMSRSLTQILLAALYHAGKLQRTKARRALKKCKRYKKTLLRKNREAGCAPTIPAALDGGDGAGGSYIKSSACVACPICYGSEVNVVTNCGHVFCVDCLTIWKDISRHCPRCRKILRSEHPLYLQGIQVINSNQSPYISPFITYNFSLLSSNFFIMIKTCLP